MSGADILSPAMDRSRPVVIVTHGSMNPVHSGHVAMMVRAKEAVEAQGWQVIKGVMGITRASHIRSKGTEPIEDAERLRLLEIACQPYSEWLTHCNGEGVKATSGSKFALLLQSSCPLNTLFGLVQGSDVFTRYPSANLDFNQDALKIIVSRAGEEETARQLRSEFRSGAEKILILPPD